MATEAPQKRRFLTKNHRNPALASPPGRDAIAHRAYETYLARGADHGHDLDDWLQAERETSIFDERRDS
jgi:hypothetical protein